MDPLKTIRAVPWPKSLRAEAGLETWTLETPFIIARGREYAIEVAVVTLHADGVTGRGESCPVFHYGETPASVIAQIRGMVAYLARGAHWADLHDTFPPGAARNAVDCAVWDLVSKLSGQRVNALLDLPPSEPVETVFTLSVAAPEAMAEAAMRAASHARLKLKLSGDGADTKRVRAVREAVPDMPLIVDVNEYWTRELLIEAMPALAECGVEMLEQPLKAGADDELKGVDRLVPIGADESCHVTADLAGLHSLYDVVNIKLDKTGGLTEALRLRAVAKELGLQTMVGCMLGTSLAMAPAHLIAQECQFVDIDAPLLIGRDRKDGLGYSGGQVAPPSQALWG